MPAISRINSDYPSVTLTNSANTTPVFNIEGFAGAVLRTGPGIASVAVTILVSLDNSTFVELASGSPLTIAASKGYTLASTTLYGWKYMKLVTGADDSAIPFGVGLTS